MVSHRFADLREIRAPVMERAGAGYYPSLANHLLWDEPLEVTAESARRVIAVLHLSGQSAARDGEPVAVPYEDEFVEPFLLGAPVPRGRFE